MSRRTVALIVAIILAAVATIALWGYIQGERDKARGEGAAVQVYTAKEAIPAGASANKAIEDGLIAPENVAVDAAPASAIASLSQIEGRVASTTIFPGEIIIAERFVAPGQATSGITLKIPDNRQAMALQVGIVPGVANFIQPGDHVSIMAQLQVPRGGGTEQETRVQFLLQNIEVLQTGRRGFNEQGQETILRPGDAVLLVVAVNPRQAEKLAFAILQGELYLTLLPDGQAPVATQGRTNRNAFAS